MGSSKKSNERSTRPTVTIVRSAKRSASAVKRAIRNEVEPAIALLSGVAPDKARRREWREKTYSEVLDCIRAQVVGRYK